MNIGILYPRSHAHPAITTDFVDAFKTCLRHQNINFNFVTEGVGFGGVEKEVYEKAEKLLLIEKVDMLVAWVDERVLQILKPLVLSCNKMMIVVNAGANYPDNWVPQPGIIYLGLNQAFLCWLSGVKAAATSTTAAVATSFYDCGYLHVAAFVNAFTNGGGTIAFNYINKQAYNHQFDITELKDFLSSNEQVKTLLCIYDALPAALFYSRLKSFAPASALQLFVSPMMLQQTALEHLSGGFPFGVTGYLPWFNSAGLEKDPFFKTNGDYEKQPTIFSLLGWECGLVAEQVAHIAGDDYNDGEAIVKQLARCPLNSPRGSLTLDADTHFFTAPIVQCTVERNGRDMHTAILPFPADEWRNFTAQPNTGISSGWTNTYLCY